MPEACDVVEPSCVAVVGRAGGQVGAIPGYPTQAAI